MPRQRDMTKYMFGGPLIVQNDIVQRDLYITMPDSHCERNSTSFKGHYGTSL